MGLQRNDSSAGKKQESNDHFWSQTNDKLFQKFQRYVSWICRLIYIQQTAFCLFIFFLYWFVEFNLLSKDRITASQFCFSNICQSKATDPQMPFIKRQGVTTDLKFGSWSTEHKWLNYVQELVKVPLSVTLILVHLSSSFFPVSSVIRVIVKIRYSVCVG